MLTAPGNLFCHPRSDSRASTLTELLPLCSAPERELSPAFFAAYGLGKGCREHTPLLGLHRIPQQGSLARAFHEARQLDFPLRLSLRDVLLATCEELVPGGNEAHVGLSGGLDSWILAVLLRESGMKVQGWCLRSDISGYCEWTEVRTRCEQFGIPVAEIRVTETDFRQALPEFLSCTTLPIYNLHPISKLLLAHGVQARGISAFITGDGADQLFRGQHDCDLLPLTESCFHRAGVRLITPFVQPAIASFVETHGPFPNKEPVRELGAELGLPDAPKRNGLFPEVPFTPQGETAVSRLLRALAINNPCLEHSMNLLAQLFEHGETCAASPA